MEKINTRKIVIVNQAVNYLTIGLCNEFYDKFQNVSLITGSIHEQGESLHNNIEIKYINKWIEVHGLKKMFVYAKALFNIYILLLTKYRNHEVFFISVPPMGYLLNILLKNRVSVLIWDVYPDLLKITGMKESNLIYRLWSVLNRISFKKAYRIYTISEKMANLLNNYVNQSKVLIQPIWSIFQSDEKILKEDNPIIKKYNLQGKFIVQYSGNIGLTHNVETLVEIAEILKEESDIVFQIIGRGPRKKFIENLVKEKNLPNCHFLPFQSDEMFPKSLAAADLGVVILDESTSMGSVPSKSYNLMALGIPSLYIASRNSQLSLYASKYKHANCFEKSELNSVANWIKELSNNSKLKGHLSKNALIASADFKRQNAKRFIDLYLKE